MAKYGHIGFWIQQGSTLANTLFLDQVWNEIIVQSIPTAKG